MQTMSGSGRDTVDDIHSSPVDRISTLPNDILLHILSFVTTRKAIETSLLSKSWKKLWTSVPALRFDQNEFPLINNSSDPKFLEFVEEALARRWDDDNIKKFYFSTTWEYEDRWGEWILHAIRKKNVEELVLIEKFLAKPDQGPENYYEIPRCIFLCQSLRVLEINLTRWVLKLPHTFSLCGLISLHLVDIVAEGDSLSKLIRSCPLLEDLYLLACQVGTLTISGNKLKKLYILYCGGEGESSLHVSLPSLLSFGYYPSGRQHCSLENLVSLVDAEIKLEFDDLIIDICGILHEIRNATSIKLYHNEDQNLFPREVLAGRLPIFHKLTCLEFEFWWSNGGQGEAIINILHHSPNLKTLIITNFELLEDSSKLEDDSWAPNDISQPSLLHLREVKIKNFNWSPFERWFVKFLLRCSKFRLGYTKFYRKGSLSVIARK